MRLTWRKRENYVLGRWWEKSSLTYGQQSIGHRQSAKHFSNLLHVERSSKLPQLTRNIKDRETAVEPAKAQQASLIDGLQGQNLTNSPLTGEERHAGHDILSHMDARYATDDSKHARAAREILAEPSKIYSVGEGCSRCILAKAECIWSRTSTRCARCVANGSSSVWCGGRPLTDKTSDTNLDDEDVQTTRSPRSRLERDSSSAVPHLGAPPNERPSIIGYSEVPLLTALKRSSRPQHSTQTTPYSSPSKNITSKRARPKSPLGSPLTPSKRRQLYPASGLGSTTGSLENVQRCDDNGIFKSHGSSFGALDQHQEGSKRAAEIQKHVLQVHLGLESIEHTITDLESERDRALAEMEEIKKQLNVAIRKRDQAFQERDRALDDRDVAVANAEDERDEAIAEKNRIMQEKTSFSSVKRLLSAVGENQIDTVDLWHRALTAKGVDLGLIYGDTPGNHEGRILEVGKKSPQIEYRSSWRSGAEPKPKKMTDIFSKADNDQTNATNSGIGTLRAGDAEGDTEEFVQTLV